MRGMGLLPMAIKWSAENLLCKKWVLYRCRPRRACADPRRGKVTHDECRYTVALTLSKIAERWEAVGKIRFTGDEVADVLRKTAADLAAKIGGADGEQAPAAQSHNEQSLP